MKIISCGLTDRTIFAIIGHAAGSLICAHLDKVDSKTSPIGDANMFHPDTDTAQATETAVGEWSFRQRRDEVGLTA